MLSIIFFSAFMGFVAYAILRYLDRSKEFKDLKIFKVERPKRGQNFDFYV